MSSPSIGCVTGSGTKPSMSSAASPSNGLVGLPTIHFSASGLTVPDPSTGICAQVVSLKPPVATKQLVRLVPGTSGVKLGRAAGEKGLVDGASRYKTDSLSIFGPAGAVQRIAVTFQVLRPGSTLATPTHGAGSDVPAVSPFETSCHVAVLAH